MKSKTPKSAQKKHWRKNHVGAISNGDRCWLEKVTNLLLHACNFLMMYSNLVESVEAVVWCWCIQLCLCERWSQYIEKSRLASFQRECIQSTTHHLLEPRTDNIYFPTIIIIISNIISYNLHNRPSTGEKWWVDTSALSGLFDEKVFFLSFIEASAFFHQYYPSFYS